jgi:VCBS repeat-containing protein/ELWxxDGT repeat protein
MGDRRDVRIVGTNHSDLLVGTDSKDEISGKGGDDIIDAGAGKDTVSGGRGDDVVSGGGGNDELNGDSGDDRLDGGEGNDCLDGGAGDDILVGGAGNDELDGGRGRDIAKYAGSVFDYKISIDGCSAKVRDLNPADGDSGRDQLSDIEEIHFDDRVIYLDGRNNDPLAKDDQAETAEDAGITIAVLDNDFDLDGKHKLKVVSVDASGTLGQVSLNPDGTIAYDPNGQFDHLADGATATDTFTYTIKDKHGGYDTATVTVTISGKGGVVNGAPIAQADAFTTGEDVALTGNVLADNGAGADADPDGDALTVNTTPVAGPANGTLVLNADGSFTYTPNADFHGTDSFTYEVSNGNGGTDQATVTITVDPVVDVPEPPSIVVNNGNDAFVQEDGSVHFAVAASLSANAKPAEFLTVTVTGFDPAWGAVSVPPVGTFNPAGTEWTFTLPPGMASSTGFTFTPAANSDLDLTGLVATATATNPDEGTSTSVSDSFDVIVEAVADAPTLAVSDASGEEDSAIALDVAATLTDTDGSETLALSVENIPVGATLSDGSNSFTASAGDTSADISGWNLAGLTITVPDAGHYALAVRATATEAANGDTEETSATLNLEVEAAATGLMVFQGSDFFRGSELWQYDGTSVTLLADVYADFGSSGPGQYGGFI